MTDLELEQISNHVSNIPAVASMYIPALLKAVSELRKERDEALASDAESCAMYRSARDRAEQAEQKLKQTQAELKRTQDYAEGPSWGTHRESLVSVAERQRQACLQGWIDMCWKVARENASVGPDGWLERYHPEDNEVSQMLRTVPLVTGEDK
jgi:hypothetical protein